MASAHALEKPAGSSPDQMKRFIRSHFEEFVNRKNLDIAAVNFSPDFVDHGSDVPPGTPPGPEGAKEYVGNALKRFPDLHVTVEDVIVEGDKIVVRNTWRATDPQSGRQLRFGGIVIWRVVNGQLAERWAYLESARAE